MLDLVQFKFVQGYTVYSYLFSSDSLKTKTFSFNNSKLRAFICVWALVAFCSPGVFGVGANEGKVVQVMERDFVILHGGDVIHTYDEIEWSFGNIRIARIKRVIGDNPQYEDERFRDRLNLNQTGSLTITNTRTTDSGLYKLSVKIENEETIKSFNVTVYGE